MKNFFECKDEKITEKAFSQSLIISVVSILLCLVALCSVTWAWFSKDVTSSSNTIKTGSCIVTVSVMNEGSEMDPKADTECTYSFEANKSYVIKITSNGSAESSYCKLIIGGQDFYTEQVSTSEPNNTISFTLAFDAPTEVEIITRWGTYLIPNDARNFYNGKSYTNLAENAG